MIMGTNSQEPILRYHCIRNSATSLYVNLHKIVGQRLLLAVAAKKNQEKDKNTSSFLLTFKNI